MLKFLRHKKTREADCMRKQIPRLGRRSVFSPFPMNP